MTKVGKPGMPEKLKLKPISIQLYNLKRNYSALIFDSFFTGIYKVMETWGLKAKSHDW